MLNAGALHTERVGDRRSGARDEHAGGAHAIRRTEQTRATGGTRLPPLHPLCTLLAITSISCLTSINHQG